MRSTLFVLTVLAFVAALLAFRYEEKYQTANGSDRKSVYFNRKHIIRCTPDWNEVNEWIDNSDIPPIPGAGNYAWKINTRNDSAQFYFNQGINMYYSFHIIEAMASFKKATRFDPSCAMLYWAEALTYGPNINDVGYSASPEALEAVMLAKEHLGNATAKEKLLVAAQNVRYSPDSTQAREKLNQLYVDAMKKAYDQFPTDADVAALYADALMLQHPWDLWRNNGTPKPWTPLIRSVLEKLLVRTPLHPGANHYYIHVMEASPEAAKATAAADRLGKLTPGLSHTVHMPSHIYLRTGQYAKGVAVNEAAISSFQKTIPLYEPVTGNAFLYLIHNQHMQTNNAMLAGRSAYSITVANETANSIPVEYLSTPGTLGNYIQYVAMTPTLADIRFGKWNDLLGMPQPDSKQVYSNILYRFGRGMALIHQSRVSEANFELEQLQQALSDPSLAIPFTPFSSALEGATVAENLLKGSIALFEKRYSEAITAFEKAVTTESNMVYNEPRDWLLNPKHFLGDAYIKAGKFDAAIAVLEKDMLNNRENGWALIGLVKAYEGKKDLKKAADIRRRYKKAFSQADIDIQAPVF